MNLSLLTDLYQLTMLCGYYSHQKLEQQSCFDLYFRRLPFSGGFCLAGGLEPALEWLESLKFECVDSIALKELTENYFLIFKKNKLKHEQ